MLGEKSTVVGKRGRGEDQIGSADELPAPHKLNDELSVPSRGAHLKIDKR